jgi:hypothetical protein
MALARILNDCRVLIVDDDDRQRCNVANVVRSAGAIVVGSARCYQIGMDMIKDRIHIHVMIASISLLHRDVINLIDAACDKNIRTVIIASGDNDMSGPLSDYPCLDYPASDLHIVTIIADVLATTRGCIRRSSTALIASRLS